MNHFWRIFMCFSREYFAPKYACRSRGNASQLSLKDIRSHLRCKSNNFMIDFASFFHFRASREPIQPILRDKRKEYKVNVIDDEKEQSTEMTLIMHHFSSFFLSFFLSVEQKMHSKCPVSLGELCNNWNFRFIFLIHFWSASPIVFGLLSHNVYGSVTNAI